MLMPWWLDSSVEGVEFVGETADVFMYNMLIILAYCCDK